MGVYSILIELFIILLQLSKFLFRKVVQQILLDIVLGRQLEAVFADEEILRKALGGILYGGHTVVLSCAERQVSVS